MPTNHPRALSFSDRWFDRLGIGILVVHGRTIVRATATAFQLLGRESEQVIGRDLLQLVNTVQIDSLKEWFTLIYDNADLAGTIVIDSKAGIPRRFRLTAGPNEGGTASSRAIAIEEISAENETSNAITELRRTLKELLDGDPVPTFVLNAEHVIMHWNRACEVMMGISAQDMVGTQLQWKPFDTKPRPVLADLVIDGITAEEAADLYDGSLRRSTVIPNGLEASGFFPHIGDNGRWLLFTAAPLRNSRGMLIGAIETLVDVSELKRAEQALRESQVVLEELVNKRTAQLETAKQALENDIHRRERAENELLSRYSELTELNIKLSSANDQIQAAQNQLVQNEKLASIGQLAAGVAHEINNPIGYVFSNFGTLEHYLTDLLNMIDAYRAIEPMIADTALQQQLTTMRERLDLDFLRQDTLSLMHESREGIERVRKIVQDLKDFSHVDASSEWQWADLHRGLESTLNIVSNEIKYRAVVVREFGQIPQIQCLPSQLNQVFMNLLVNAAHAMENQETNQADAASLGSITVRTGTTNEEVWVEIRDTGCGMSPETISKIFDPFFTTKPVGKGTGLGLSLSYGVIHKHHGRIEVDSVVGKGSSFRVVLPVRQTQAAAVETAA